METGSLPPTRSAHGAGRIVDARRRIENLPVWLFALLTVTGFDALALGGLVCTRSLGNWLGLYTLIENDTFGWFFSAMLVMYALSLGLIAVASWANASGAAPAASEEASHIATVYRTLGGYPQPLQDDLKDSIVRYTRVYHRKGVARAASRRRDGSRHRNHIASLEPDYAV